MSLLFSLCTELCCSWWTASSSSRLCGEEVGWVGGAWASRI